MTQSIYLSPTDPTEILRTINSLKARQSTGPDNISSYPIKKKSPLGKPISLLINKSLEDGIIPDIFLNTTIIPIYKSKNKALLSNYRPISLLCSLSKILEKIVHKRVYNFLQLHSIFFASQYGLRHKHSTVNAICEFSKAFDTINHDLLLSNFIIMEYVA